MPTLNDALRDCKAVIFDFNGVLTSGVYRDEAPGIREIAAMAAAQTCGVPYDEAFFIAESRRVGSELYRDVFMREYGINARQLDDAIKRKSSEFAPKYLLKSDLEAFQQCYWDKTLYILSHTPRGIIKDFVKRQQIGTIFPDRRIVTVRKSGERKTDSGTFEVFLGRRGFRPENCVLVDDKLPNHVNFPGTSVFITNGKPYSTEDLSKVHPFKTTRDFFWTAIENSPELAGWAPRRVAGKWPTP